MVEQQPAKSSAPEQGGFHLIKPREAFYSQDVTGEDGTGRTWLIKACKVVIPPLCRLLYKLEVRGKENIPPREEGPVVFVGNHVSYMDPVVLWVAAQPRKPRFLARSNLWRIPVFPTRALCSSPTWARPRSCPWVSPAQTASSRTIRRACTSPRLP